MSTEHNIKSTSLVVKISIHKIFMTFGRRVAYMGREEGWENLVFTQVFMSQSLFKLLYYEMRS